MNNLILQIKSLFSGNNEAIDIEKKHIRDHIRGLKRMISDEQREYEANAVFRKIELMPEFKVANTILIYWATSDELPTQDIIARWCREKQMLLPAIEGNKLVLKRYLPDGKLIQKNLGIWEPDMSEKYEGKVDMVIVPGVAFDKRKNRLGRGKGYYDRFFRKQLPVKIGVGFDCQLVPRVPILKHDIPMDKIVTASHTI